MVDETRNGYRTDGGLIDPTAVTRYTLRLYPFWLPARANSDFWLSFSLSPVRSVTLNFNRAHTYTSIVKSFLLAPTAASHVFNSEPWLSEAPDVRVGKSSERFVGERRRASVNWTNSAVCLPIVYLTSKTERFIKNASRRGSRIYLQILWEQWRKKER